MRGIAVLMVLMVHSMELSNINSFPISLKNFVYAGKYGVQLFFVISGFTLFYTLTNHKKDTGNFYLRRFFRIAPAYYLAILFYSWYNQTWGVGELLNFTFLHGFSPSYINSIVPSGWSVGIEMFFYLIVPVLFACIKNLSGAVNFLTISLLFRTASFFIIKLSALSKLAGEGSFVYFWFPNQLPAFAIGFVLYFYLCGDRIPSKNSTVSMMLLVGLSLISVMTELPIFSTHLLVAFAFALLIALFAKNESNPWLENRFFLFVGKVSYSAYLCQYAMIFLLKRLNFFNLVPSSIKGNSYINCSLNYFILITLTLITAYVMFLVIEQPFQKIGHKFVSKLYSVRALNI